MAVSVLLENEGQARVVCSEVSCCRNTTWRGWRCAAGSMQLLTWLPRFLLAVALRVLFARLSSVDSSACVIAYPCVRLSHALCPPGPATDLHWQQANAPRTAGRACAAAIASAGCKGGPSGTLHARLLSCPPRSALPLSGLFSETRLAPSCAAMSSQKPAADAKPAGGKKRSAAAARQDEAHRGCPAVAAAVEEAEAAAHTRRRRRSRGACRCVRWLRGCHGLR